MATDFTRFEASIRERRTYHDHWGLALELQGDRRLAPEFHVTDKNAEWFVTGTHVMNPGSPDPASPFRKQFGFDPPADFVDFFRRWDGGYLFFGVPCTLLPVEKIIEHNVEFRRLRKYPMNAPWSLIRFSDIGHNDFIGYRLKDGHWMVCQLLNEYDDKDLHAGDFEAPVLAQSFSSWIDRLISTEGALPDGVPAPMRRIASLSG